MKKKSKPFSKERKNTDDSLIAERNKSNISSIKSSNTTERRTDKAVQQARDHSDEQTASNNTQDTMKKEFVDAAIEKERSTIDDAIEKERESTKITASILLTNERAQTDKNLLKERNKTDNKVSLVSDQLLNEISEHANTKVTLTTREDFLAIVSHDLRSPMSFVSSCTQMLLEGQNSKKLDSEVKQLIKLIKENVDISLRLILDLLEMQRIMEGKLILQIKKHSINKIITSSIMRYSYIASAKNVKLTVESPDNIGEVYCDYDRITQVLSNLIDNAIKFTSPGGSITVKATASDSAVHISVHDTGSGIDKEMIEHLFDRFSQNNTKDKSGLGLGLYISKMFIVAHQGRLWVESTKGNGSTFIFSIPSGI
jgi:signal transduction histidine kinase